MHHLLNTIYIYFSFTWFVVTNYYLESSWTWSFHLWNNITTGCIGLDPQNVSLAINWWAHKNSYFNKNIDLVLISKTLLLFLMLRYYLYYLYYLQVISVRVCNCQSSLEFYNKKIVTPKSKKNRKQLIPSVTTYLSLWCLRKYFVILNGILKQGMK